MSIENIIKKRNQSVLYFIFLFCFFSYRLAPEHPYPAGLSDSVDVTRFVFENSEEFAIDPRRIVMLGKKRYKLLFFSVIFFNWFFLFILGDSGGGNILAATTLKMRDLQLPYQPKIQVIWLLTTFDPWNLY